ncbi:helix-turn-helix domain-containing protein [Enterococcus sp. LJL120]
MNIGESIKYYRNQSTLTQEDLAEKVHVSRQTISSWENSKSLPDITSLVMLSDLFQVSLDELIKGDTTMIKKLEVKQEKATYTKQYRISYALNALMALLAVLLYLTNYDVWYVYALLALVILGNVVIIFMEYDKYKEKVHQVK